MPTLAANGIEIAYLDEGAGDPILLNHGFADAKDLWRPQIAALHREYRVVAPDLRGHGETSAPDDPACYTLEGALADSLAFYDHLGLDRAVLGSLSLGAYLTLEFYRRHPDRVRALVLMACGPGYRNPATMERFNQGRRERADRLEARARDLIARGEPPIEPKSGSTLIGLAHVSRGLMQNPAALDVLPTIRVPTLVIIGSDDEPYRAAADLLGARIPGAIKVVIPNAGHRINLDQPERVNAALREFLSGLAPIEPVGARAPR